MLSLPRNETSYWMQSIKTPHLPSLNEDLEIDVVIIGAGIAGLTSAYLLKQAGLKVAVIEKDIVGAGVSGHTTGKITSQHHLIYAKLTEQLGEETAQIYGEANQAAIGKIAEIIKKEKIDCDWREEESYVYTTEPSMVDRLKSEARIAQTYGLPATFETNSDLPFAVAGAVRFSRQATFHIRKYLVGLATAINGNGSYVFSNSRAIGIRDGAPGRVRTAHATMWAKDIIVATNVPTFPLMARGAYCLAEYPKQSYIVAGLLEKDLRGMYISPDKGHYSILPVINGHDKLLLIGGQGHIPGTRFNTDTRHQRLADYAEEHFGIKEIIYRWSHRDYLGYDDMPLIGLLYPWSKHVYTATGFMKWGLTNATVAAMILSDTILGNENEWATTFDPHRLQTVMSIPKVIKENLGLK